MIPYLLATFALIALALQLGGGLHESVVMAPNYEGDIPSSIAAARHFLKHRTGAHYFRPISLISQLVILASLIACWSVPAARFRMLIALGIVVLLDVITFSFHYPRLAIMFKGPMPQDVAALKRAAREWSIGNIGRVVLLLVGFVSTLQAVTLLAAR